MKTKGQKGNIDEQKLITS